MKNCPAQTDFRLSVCVLCTEELEFVWMWKMNAIKVMPIKWMCAQSIIKAKCIGICLLLHCFAISLRKRINISLQPIEYITVCDSSSRTKKINTKIKEKYSNCFKKPTYNHTHSTILLRNFPFHFSHSHTHTYPRQIFSPKSRRYG